MILFEGGDKAKGLGGNVFKDANGNPLTRRINRVDVPTTIKWLEQITGLSLKETAGSTGGNSADCGDLDFILDANVITKEAVIGVLTNWCKQQGVAENEIANQGRKYRGGYIAQTGIEVHFRAPINGNPANGYVQSDFNFVNKLHWTKFMLAPMPAGSEYKGVDRAVLFNSIGKTLGVKVNVISGVHARDTDELVTNDPAKMAHIFFDGLTDELVTDDPGKMAEMFLPAGTVRDLAGVESTISALRNDPQRDAKLKDFTDYLSKSGRQLPQLESSAHPTEWFRHLNNRLK